MGKWIARNLVNIIVFACVLGLLAAFYRDKSLAEVLASTLSLVLVIVGLGFVIFIHELGHFLAAKLCNVRVHTFSVGFGPPIPGLAFRWGETLYKLAVFPLGGYVHMQGQEDPGVEAKEGDNPEDPRSFRNKTVGQRMIIISAGVIMNVILGLGCFIYVYMAGKTEVAARFGVVEPGSPAASSGIQAGSQILQVNDNQKPIFEDVFYAGAFAAPGVTPIYLKWKTPAGEVREADIIPRKLPNDVKPLIGIKPPEGLTLYELEKQGRSPGLPGMPAAAAPLRAGDKIIGARVAGEGELRRFNNGWDLAQAEYDFRGKPGEFLVERGAEEVMVPVEPNYFHTIGLRMEMGPVTAVQTKHAPSASQRFQPGDVIIALDGDESFDPMRLPDLVTDKLTSDEAVELTILREGKQVSVKIDPDGLPRRGTWNEEQPLGPGSPVSIPILGIAYRVRTKVAAVEEGSPAAGKLNKGDIIEEVAFPGGGDVSSAKAKPAIDQWPSVFWSMQVAPVKTFQMTVKRAESGQTETVELTAAPDKTWPFPDRGFKLQGEVFKVYAANWGEAITLGLRYTARTIGRIYLNLKALFVGNISPWSLVGPIGIPQIAYSVASQGLVELIGFLGMISINLAVINFLPVPILDGGHMLFLFIEKIRGKPVSEKALIIANTIGIVLLGCLMVFVIFLDISRMF